MEKKLLPLIKGKTIIVNENRAETMEQLRDCYDGPANVKHAPDKRRCRYDDDGDGDCRLCIRRGGCSAIGGPF